MTKQDIQEKWGNGESIHYIFKGNEPFTEAPNGAPMGMLIETEEGIVCWECGKCFQSLGAHTARAHKMTSYSFREKYSLRRKVALCTTSSSRRYSESAVMKNSGWIKSKEEMDAMRVKARTAIEEKSKLGTLKTGSVQRDNEKGKIGVCEPQLLDIYRLCQHKYNTKIPSRDQILESYPEAIHKIDNVYGGLNKWRKDYGFEIRLSYREMKKDKADLINDIRDHVKSYGKIPFIKNNRLKGFPHSLSMYARYFGSKRRAWVECGIKEVARGKGQWEVYG